MTENIAALIDKEVFVPNGQEIVDAKDIGDILEKYAGARGGLIAILEEIQNRYGYLPETALRVVAENMGISLVDVYAVATFYSTFSLQPRGRHIVCACMGTACHVRGAPRVVEEFEHRLGINAGETTFDREFTLETVNCLGACALGPVVVIDGHYISKVKKTGVRQLIDDSVKGFDRIRNGEDKRIFPITVSCSRCNCSLMNNRKTIDGHPAIRISVASGGQHGRLWLSSLYGSPGRMIEHDIPPNAVADFLCPHCHGLLIGHENCGECGAPMAVMIVSGGGMLKVCSRIGCRGHMLDLA